MVLFIYDAKQGIQKEDEEILDFIKSKKYIVAANKADLVQERKDSVIYISAQSGEGIEELKKSLTNQVKEIEPDSLEFVTNVRQQTCLNRAKTSLDQALLASQIGELQDLISIDIKAALLALDELTGELITDDILDNIFENFCIGK